MMIDQWNFIPYLFHKPICGISYALFMKWFPLIDTLVFFTDDTDGLAPSCAKLVYLYICSWQEYLPECSSFIVREGWGPHIGPCFLFQNLIAAMWRCLIIRTLLIAIYVYIYSHQTLIFVQWSYQPYIDNHWYTDYFTTKLSQPENIWELSAVRRFHFPRKKPDGIRPKRTPRWSKRQEASAWIAWVSEKKVCFIFFAKEWRVA